MTLTPLVFDEAGARYYETGVSKGIFFPIDGSPGVPWNGLVSVSVDVSGGALESSYFDGRKYKDKVLAEEFQATVTAVSTPPEFKKCEGVREFAPGVNTSFNKRDKFHMVWRTEIGNDEGASVGYKIHVAYNCLVQPTARTYQTLADSVSMDSRAFVITTTPACGRHSYFWFDSREHDLTGLEAELYVGNLPACSQLSALIDEPIDLCPALLTDFEDYNPGEFVDDDVVDGANETIIHGRINNGLDVTDLPAAGAFAANDSAASEVGTGDVVADGDDATYITSADGDLGYTIALPPLVGYVDGADFELHIRMSVSGDIDPNDPDNLDADAQVFITTDSGGDLPVGGFSDGEDEGVGFSIDAVDGSIQDYVVPLNMDPWNDLTIDDVVTALEAGAYLNVVAVSNNNPSTTPVVNVYEATVTMVDTTRRDKFLRADPEDEVFCTVEQHIYSTGTSDTIVPTTTSVEFMVRKVPYLSDADGWYQELMFWNGVGPALFKVDSHLGQPRLQLIDEDTSSLLVDLIPIQNTWYKAEIYWSNGSYRFHLYQDNDREYGPGTELPYALTHATSAVPVAFAEHIGGFVGESTGTTFEAVLDNASMSTHCHDTVEDTLFFKLSTDVPTPMGGSTLVGAADVATALGDSASTSYVDIPPRDTSSHGPNLSLIPNDLTGQGWTWYRLEIDYEVVGGGSANLTWELSAVDPLGGTMSEWNAPATFSGSGTLVETLPVSSSGFRGQSDPGHFTIDAFLEEAALPDTSGANVWFSLISDVVGQPHLRLTGLRIVVSKSA